MVLYKSNKERIRYKKNKPYIRQIFKTNIIYYLMKISEKKKERICEQIISLLNSVAPKALFTFHIAQEIARDEMFIKKLLLELKSKGLIVDVNKNPQGKPYIKRTRWRLKDKEYSYYNNL